MDAFKSVLKNCRFAGIMTVVITVFLMLGSIAARAQAAPPGEAGWNYGLILYGWGTGLSGDVGPNIRQFEVHASTSDILSNLDFAAMAHFEAHNGKWGILVDPIYANLGKTVDEPGAPPRGPSTSIWKHLPSASRRATRSTRAPAPTSTSPSGARYTGLSTDITPRRLPAFHASYSWVDPVVGLVGSVRMSNRRGPSATAPTSAASGSAPTSPGAGP